MVMTLGLSLYCWGNLVCKWILATFGDVTSLIPVLNAVLVIYFPIEEAAKLKNIIGDNRVILSPILWFDVWSNSVLIYMYIYLLYEVVKQIHSYTFQESGSLSVNCFHLFSPGRVSTFQLRAASMIILIRGGSRLSGRLYNLYYITVYMQIYSMSTLSPSVRSLSQSHLVGVVESSQSHTWFRNA